MGQGNPLWGSYLLVGGPRVDSDRQCPSSLTRGYRNAAPSGLDALEIEPLEPLGPLGFAVDGRWTGGGRAGGGRLTGGGRAADGRRTGRLVGDEGRWVDRLGRR